MQQRSRARPVSQRNSEKTNVNMSVIGVHPPQFLNLSSENLAEAFRDFRQSWDIFVLASEIEAKPDNIKVALLKNFLGLDAVKVLDTLLPVADQVNPGVILNALGGYCLPQTNETFVTFCLQYGCATGKRRSDRVRQSAEKVVCVVQFWKS